MTWIPYFMGQILFTLCRAQVICASDKNNVRTLGQFFRAQLIPLVSRVFLSSLCFVLVWDNPAAVNIQRFMGNATEQFAIAGILGWFSDSVMDKVVAMVPWLRHELPPRLNGHKQEPTDDSER